MIPASLRHLTCDGWLLFATRFIRLFAYGSLSVVLVFYLVGVGLSEPHIGLLLTLTLAGDTLVSLYLTTRADRLGRGRMLMAGALLMAAAGIVFASTSRFWLLVVAGTIGVISPSGNEVGPFLSDRAGRAVAGDPRPRPGRRYSPGTRWPGRSRRRSARWRRARRRACCSPASCPGPTAIARWCIAVRGARSPAGRALHAPLVRGRAAHSWRAAAAPSDLREPLGARPIDGRRAQARRVVRARLVRRRFRGAELRGVLVLPALRRRSRHARRDLLLGEHPGGNLGAARVDGWRRASA